MRRAVIALLFLLASLPASAQNSNLRVESLADGVTIRTPKAEFQLYPDGSLRTALLAKSARLTLDQANEPADALVANGKPVHGFTANAAAVRVADTGGPMGKRGKRVSIPAVVKLPDGASIERTITLEVYEDFPELLLSTTAYRNTGRAPLRLESVTTARHRLDSRDAASGAPAMWSFHGASVQWGLDDVTALKPGFFRPNPLGASQADGLGGGVPIVAVWTKNTGIAIGHLDTNPLTVSIPVRVDQNGAANVELSLRPEVTLNTGESWATPRVFHMVYAGDYYEPLRMYSLALQREGWKLPKPSEEAYSVAWCGWGYEADVTPHQMLGIIPKLKEYHIRWATLDDRWFDTYGDWNPRGDTFPGLSIKDLVDEYHHNGIMAQIWWLPLGVEIPGPKYEGHAYAMSKVAKQHPDWLILDRSGKPEHMTRQLAALCPAVPEVQQYTRELTYRFIHDWGFDGHKLDNIFSVPPCYNPAHHHKSPYDSVNAMGEIYRIIFETTRELKPYSVTQSCPCGTPPNIGWVRFMDQAVTADPVGSQQVRRRVKMYKALLGPQAAVYGDHVELTEVTHKGRAPDSGNDFASSFGTGAVLGTKFVWPQTDPKYKTVVLTPDKDRQWKKWMDLYHEKMLSRGNFLNLYSIGFDTPEGYAIEKNGKMYYAFFAGLPDDSYSGEIELRGLKAGTYRVTDYVNNRDLGTVTVNRAVAAPHVKASFKNALLLEVGAAK